MKYIGLIIISLMILASCEPIDDRESLESTTSASAELDKITVIGFTEGSNKVILANNSKVTGRWNHDFGVSNKKNDTVIFATFGEKIFEFLAATDAGIIKVEKTVTVSQIDTELPAPLSYLVGSLGKGITWVYAEDYPDSDHWGMVADYDWTEWWWTPDLDDGNENGYTDEVTFDLNGAPHFTIVEKEGDDPKAGTFNFSAADMTLTLPDLSICDKLGENFVHEDKDYQVVVLNENELVLFQPYSDAGHAWIWRFKRKGYSYPEE